MLYGMQEAVDSIFQTNTKWKCMLLTYLLLDFEFLRPNFSLAVSFLCVIPAVIYRLTVSLPLPA